MDRHLRSLKKLAKQFGRTVETTKRGHFRLVCKRGARPYVVASNTPSDPRTRANLIAELKRNDK